MTDQREAPESDRLETRDLRRFGFSIAGCLFALSGLRWWWTKEPPLVTPAIAAAAALLAAVAPGALRPLRRLANMLGAWAQRGVTAAAMFTAFWLVITPSGLAMRLFQRDPLKQAWRPDFSTYWEDPEEQPEDLERYRHPF